MHPEKEVLLDIAKNLRQEVKRIEYLVRLKTALENGKVFASPVGTDIERNSRKVWPGQWIDATGYARHYYPGGRSAYHTGADLNLNHPVFDADAHAPVYAIADGEVYAIRSYSGWHKVLCIRHENCLSRCAHVENIQVREGDKVELGQHICNIGNAGGLYPYHLHFDIARLDSRMAKYPGDWPGLDKSRLLRDYFDPQKFLIGNA